MSIAYEGTLIARNPATGAELGQVGMTAPGAVVDRVSQARRAQASWGNTPWRERQAWLQRWSGSLASEADAWADAIVSEIGKPHAEAMAEVVMALDAIRWTARHGGKALDDEWLGSGHQRLLLIPGASVQYRPLGVIGIVGTWNYPLFLNAPAIAQAVAAGNGVVWKPSELASFTGLRLQESLDRSGLPEGLVSAVFGGPEIGEALVDSPLDKGVFTGGFENGRRVLSALARHGIPALGELSGFDPAIVLPDARPARTLRPLSWAAFVGCGQTCVAVKRVIVVGDPAPWAEGLARSARALRVGDPASRDVDLGPLITSNARDRFHRYVHTAVEAGARLLTETEPTASEGWFVAPTVLLADSPAQELALEGVFGPVVVVRGVPDIEAAVAAANASRFALAASVWGEDLDVARPLAARLNAGQVTINDAVTPTGHGAAPFGGVKASGYGRIKGCQGIREFLSTQAVFSRYPGGFRPQCFPYGSSTQRMLRWYIRLFHSREPT